MAEHKEYWTTDEKEGTIRISEEVVASIAALAASETEGVSGLYAGKASDFVSFLNKKNLSKGVKILLGDDDSTEIEVGILVLYGQNIAEVAKQVQSAVKSAVESMTGLRVVSIGVHVGGVSVTAAAAEE